jgi:hypothetical protein
MSSIKREVALHPVSPGLYWEILGTLQAPYDDDMHDSAIVAISGLFFSRVA